MRWLHRAALRPMFAVSVVAFGCGGSEEGLASNETTIDGGSDAVTDGSIDGADDTQPDHCTPVCEERQCGSDSCGGQCSPGCSDGLICTSSGTCVACPDQWASNQTSPLLDLALDPGGLLYVTGSDAEQGWVAALDRCDGTTQGSTSFDAEDADETVASSVVVDGDSVFVAGTAVMPSDPMQGMIARLTKEDLAFDWASTLYGSTGQDEVWGVTATAGDLWMTGVADAIANPVIWGIKADRTGEACGFPGPAGVGAGHCITSQSTKVYMGVILNGGTSVVRYDDSACSLPGPCPCPSEWQSSTLTLGATRTDPRAIVVLDTTAYVAGFSVDSSTDYLGFVTSFDLDNGTVTGTFVWQGTGERDGFVALETDGDRLYVGGLRGWTGDTSFASASAVVLTLPMDLSTVSVAEWTSFPTSMNLVTALAVEPGDEGGLFVAGLTDNAGRAIRCTKGGICP